MKIDNPTENTSSARMRNVHFEAIQALRAVAALGVCTMHCVDLKVGLYKQNEWPFFFKLSNYLNSICGSGVDLFFVLSGFLIYSISMKTTRSERSSAAWQFAVKRAFRIYPLYWFVLLTMVVTQIGLHFESAAQTIGKITPRTIFLLTDSIPFPPPGWTLSYEVWFYAGSSLIIFILPKRKILSGFALWGIIQIILYYLIVKKIIDCHFYALRQPQVLDFFLGCLVAFIIKIRRIKNTCLDKFLALGISFVVLLTGAIISYAREPSGALGWGERVVYSGIPSALAVYALVGLERQGRLRAPLGLVHLGDISYSIYLWHFEISAVSFWIMLHLKVYAQLPPLILVILEIITTIIVSIMTYALIEKPSQILARFVLHLQSSRAIEVFPESISR
ncbi:acyltransferase family protein [Acetobacter indonesiensis]|uniref:acyltransferase family protein n=1 Tax=Acetobacter indonesiensis TaxID=104101 RepID=UPI0009FE2188|nr:acyltransferase [Acetobacter indonesiensis]